MAEQPKVETASEVEEIALDVFGRMAANGRGNEQGAVQAFKAAEAFIAMRARFRKGEFKPVVPLDGPQLCDCWAPNLPETHPHNLVSQQVGNLSLVAKIHRWLEENPVSDKDDPFEIVDRFKAKFRDVNWGAEKVDVLAAIGTARAIFPAYVKN